MLVSDRSDFELYVVSASARLVRTAWLLVGDRQVAEDLAQETLIRMYRHWRRIMRVEARGAYAHRTIVRLARRHMRRASSRLEVTGTEPAQRTYQSGEQSALRDEVREALMRLPHRQREALVLRYFLDFSIETAAAAMGCEVGTVKSQCSKGLAKLRAELRETTEPARVGGDDS